LQGAGCRAYADHPRRQQAEEGALEGSAAVGTAAEALYGLARTRFSDATADANRRARKAADNRAAEELRNQHRSERCSRLIQCAPDATSGK